MDQIKQWDSQLFVYLNGLGSETWDPFWLGVTKWPYWVPFYLLLFFLVYRKLGTKQLLWFLLLTALLITVSDQITNLFKAYFQRPRPCSALDICDIIRSVKTSSSFGFFSGHAANSMANATLIFLTMRRYYRAIWLIFLWPLVFGYSRIYLGLHYPGDIMVGYFFGALFGWIFYRLWLMAQKKWNPAP